MKKEPNVTSITVKNIQRAELMTDEELMQFWPEIKDSELPAALVAVDAGHKLDRLKRKLKTSKISQEELEISINVISNAMKNVDLRFTYLYLYNSFLDYNFIIVKFLLDKINHNEIEYF